MGDGGLGRPLIQEAVDAQGGGEPVQFVDIVGQQMCPGEPAPPPDRLVDVNRHRPPRAFVQQPHMELRESSGN